MYKKPAALALLTAAACLGTGAQAADVTGWFVNGGIGSAHYHATYEGLTGRESGTAFQINGGWRSQFIGFEGGYVDLGSIGEHDDIGDSAKLSGKGWTLGLNGHFNPTPFACHPRGINGAAYSRANRPSSRTADRWRETSQ